MATSADGGWVQVPPDQPFQPWPAPGPVVVQRQPRPWWHYVGITVAIVLWLAGVALVAFIVLMMVLLAQVGSNK